MKNRFVITLESDNTYLYLSANFGDNLFTTKVKLESIKKVTCYIMQMLNSAK